MQTSEHTINWMKTRFGEGTVVTISFMDNTRMDRMTPNSRTNFWFPSETIEQWLKDHGLNLRWGYGEDNEAHFFFPEGNEAEALLFKMTFS